MKTTADKQQQQQHDIRSHTPTQMSDKKASKSTMRLQDRWSKWVEDQNRKNEQRASKPDNIVVSKLAGALQAMNLAAITHADVVLAVVLCAGLLVWCYYGQSCHYSKHSHPICQADVGLVNIPLPNHTVYVGRICTPMIRQDPGARGSKAQGSQ